MRYLVPLMFLVCSTVARAADDVSHLIADQALEIRRLHEQLETVQRQLTSQQETAQRQLAAQQAAPNQQLLAAQTRLHDICASCGTVPATVATTETCPKVAPKDTRVLRNRVIAVAGSGPNGLSISPGVSPSVAVTVGPVAGLGYSREVYEEWSAVAIATRSFGSHYVNYTALLGVGYDW